MGYAAQSNNVRRTMMFFVLRELELLFEDKGAELVDVKLLPRWIGRVLEVRHERLVVRELLRRRTPVPLLERVLRVGMVPASA